MAVERVYGYMGIGWLILSLMYQQGEYPECGNQEWRQVTVCSGFC